MLTGNCASLFAATGAIAALAELGAKLPPGVRDLTRVPGLGPKRALLLSRELNIGSVEELKAAVTAGRLRDLAGFGAVIVTGVPVLALMRVWFHLR